MALISWVRLAKIGMAVIFRGDVLRMTVAYTHVPTLILQHRRTPPPPSKSSTTMQHRHPMPAYAALPWTNKVMSLPTGHNPCMQLQPLRLCERNPLSSSTLQLLHPTLAAMVTLIVMQGSKSPLLLPPFIHVFCWILCMSC